MQLNFPAEKNYKEKNKKQLILSQFDSQIAQLERDKKTIKIKEKFNCRQKV